jgi:hypothetical protein
MKEYLKKMYGIELNAMIKVAPKVYKIKTTQGDYILKYIDNIEIDNIYSRLSMLKISTFSIPKKNIYGQYVTSYENRYFELDDYYEDETIVAKDIRIRFYLTSLANLHNQSFFSLKVNHGFFDESYDFIEGMIKQVSDELETTLQHIERLDYKSPSQWLLLLNNQLFYKAINQAKSYLNSFKEKTKDKTMLRVALNYLNFDYSHIIVKQSKIISTHKMIIGPPVYDLKHLFDKSFQGSIDIGSFLSEYLNKFHLNEYEKDWLLALLMIPILDFKGDNEVEKIVNITNTVHHLKNAEEIAELLTEAKKQDDDTKIDN